MLLQTSNVNRYFGAKPALTGFSFALDQGEKVAFLGAAKAGKSTALRIITGFIAPNHGTVRFAGRDPRLPAARRTLAYMPEGAPLPGHMRVGDFLRYRARLKGVSRRQVKNRVEECLIVCGIDHIRTTLISRLSACARRLVGIAECMLAKPELVVLDSPTDGLSASETDIVRSLIAAVGRESAIIVSSESIEDVDALCPRAVLLEQGRVVADNGLDEICRIHVEERLVVVDIVANEPVRETLRAVTGVKAVSIDAHPEDPKAVRVKLTIPSGVDLRREVADIANRRGWLITRIFLEPVRLEDLFRRKTGG